MKNYLRKIFTVKQDSFEPNWEKLKCKKNINYPKILFATSAGCLNFNVKLETLLAKSLSYKGADVEFLLCDHPLQVCLGVTSHNFNKDKDFLSSKNRSHYDYCFENGLTRLSKSGLKINIFSKFLNQNEVRMDFRKIKSKINFDNIEKLKYKNFNIGENAKSGALRYLAKGQFAKKDVKILNAYVLAALKTYNVMSNLNEFKKFDIIVLNHGIYVPQGAIVDFAKKNKIKSISWCASSKKNSFIFSNHDTYHKSLLSEPNKKWENIVLTNKKIKKIKHYLKSRAMGSKDWIYFHNKQPNFDIKKFFKTYRINENKPIVTLLTNVVWDAQLHFKKNIFKNMNEWVFHAINYFKKNRDKQLIIRAHPAEITGGVPSKEKIGNLINKKFQKLSDNIKFIGPENKLSTYPLCYKSDSILIYGTKMGFELAPIGKPILVAGESWVRNKKITYDPTNLKKYNLLLKNIDKKKITKQKRIRALKYAYHYFFRRSIPISVIKNSKERNTNFTFKKNIITTLKKGKDPGINLIVNSIIYNNDFIFGD